MESGLNECLLRRCICPRSTEASIFDTSHESIVQDVCKSFFPNNCVQKSNFEFVCDINSRWIMLDRWMPLMNKQTFMTPPWMWQESVDKRPFLGGALEGESKIFNHVKNYNSFQSFCSVPDDKAIAEEKPLHNYGAQGLNIVQHASNNEVPIVAGSNAVVARAPVLNFPTTYNHADAVGRLYTNGFRLKHRKQSSKKHHHKGKN
jgi:hypothetical protein